MFVVPKVHKFSTWSKYLNRVADLANFVSATTTLDFTQDTNTVFRGVRDLLLLKLRADYNPANSWAFFFKCKCVNCGS